MKKVDLTGRKFGRLTVVEEAGRSKYGLVLWKCACNCGNIKIFYGTNLTRGLTTSCGCFRTETTVKRSTTHGQFHTLAYKTWGEMIQRCTNPNNSSYPDYGGRGIKVCKRWLMFENFLKDMRSRLSHNLSIERVNNDGDYTPNNCIWADKFTQARNKRIYKNNKTGVNGVCLHKGNKKYSAYIWLNGKQKTLGSFDTIEEAGIARKEAELKFWQ